MTMRLPYLRRNRAWLASTLAAQARPVCSRGHRVKHDSRMLDRPQRPVYRSGTALKVIPRPSSRCFAFSAVSWAISDWSTTSGPAAQAVRHGARIDGPVPTSAAKTFTARPCGGSPPAAPAEAAYCLVRRADRYTAGIRELPGRRAPSSPESLGIGRSSRQRLHPDETARPRVHGDLTALRHRGASACIRCNSQWFFRRYLDYDTSAGVRL